MKFALTLIIVVSCSLLNAQDLLLHQETKQVLSDKSEFGPNKKHYRHSFMGFQFFVPTFGSKEYEVKGLNSLGAYYGIRTKRRFSEVFSAGYDFALTVNQFDAVKDSNSSFGMIYGSVGPDTLTVDKLVYGSLLGSGYVRINMGQRGNHLGRYIDFVGYLEYITFSQHVAKFDHPNDQLQSSSVVKIKDLAFVRRFQYGAEFRFGNGFYNIWMRYRLSDIFNDKLKTQPFQPAALSLGVNLVLAG